MTREVWEHCVWVCFRDGDALQLRKLLAEHPEYVQEWKGRYEAEYNDPNSMLRQKEEEHWSKLNLIKYLESANN